MTYEQIVTVLSRIKGCTFAALEAETKVRGLRRVVRNELVMLFTNQRTSGYENMVKRRLESIGKDPESFLLSDRAWGQRIPNSPLVKHLGFYYLDTILLHEGEEKYYMGESEVLPHLLSSFGIKPSVTSQGLPEDKQVLVRTYALENIKSLRVMGETLTDEEAPRRKLSLFKKDRA